jgi:hypothetical protein
MLRKIAISVLTPLFSMGVLVSCASKPEMGSRESRELSGLAPAFFLMAHRRGEIEPCGCSISPKGGVAREATAARQLAQPPLGSISTGITFIPREFRHFGPERLLGRARFMVDALNLLNTSIVAPAIEDGLLGTESVRVLQQRSKFEWVGTNLVDKKSGKLVFASHIQKQIGGQKFTFLGLSHSRVTEKGLNSAWKAESPVKALEAFFSKHNAESLGVVVVLSSLSGDERRQIEPFYNRIHFVLGGDVEEAFSDAKQVGASTAIYAPQSRGRVLSLVGIQANQKFTALYSHATAASALENSQVWERLRANLQQEIALHKTDKKRSEELKLQLKRAESALADFNAVPKVSSDSVLPFSIQQIHLDDAFDNPPAKDLLDLIDSYKKFLREISLRTTR